MIFIKKHFACSLTNSLGRRVSSAHAQLRTSSNLTLFNRAAEWLQTLFPPIIVFSSLALLTVLGIVTTTLVVPHRFFWTGPTTTPTPLLSLRSRSNSSRFVLLQDSLARPKYLTNSWELALMKSMRNCCVHVTWKCDVSRQWWWRWEDGHTEIRYKMVVQGERSTFNSSLSLTQLVRHHDTLP